MAKHKPGYPRLGIPMYLVGVMAWFLPCLQPLTALRAYAEVFWTWAERPVMGWNSWDFYGTSVNEDRVKAQADFMATNLLRYGWNLITIDIQWYEPNATGFVYNPNAVLSMDQWGRLTPATNRFPSAAGGLGFKPLADYVHARGLRFGLHLMRGIPRQAVFQNTPVLGTTNSARDIVDTSSTCPWNPDMFGVDMTKPGAQAYYDSVLALLASWEVDFIKVDDIGRPYHAAELEAIRRAINRTGRTIVLSISPGPTPTGHVPHVIHRANQWRISDDFWDNWPALYAQFERLHQWTPWRGPGHFPDADMLPLGKIAGGSPTATGRWTRFTTNEQVSLMTLWAIARSPLIYGGDLTQMDPFTLSLLTNTDVIAVNQFSTHNRQLFRSNELIAWTADAEDCADKYLAVFNATSVAATVPVSLFLMGFTNDCHIRALWDGSDLGTFRGTFAPMLPPHGAGLYRLSGPVIPVPWITEVLTGNAQVTLKWDPIESATAYNVKRAVAEFGPYAPVATGITNTSYTDRSLENGRTYYYVVSAVLGDLESPNSGARPATPAGQPAVISWNYDRYGTVPRTGIAGIIPVSNWNNSWPDEPTANLLDSTGAPTTVDIIYNSYNGWSLQDWHPGADADGSYNKELLNGYLNAGAGNFPSNSTIWITEIPFSYYDLYVYFGSDVAGRTGTISDGVTTYSFTTLGRACITNGNAIFVRTTDTGTGHPQANYAVFTGLSGRSKTIRCHVPMYGGIAGFQLVPRPDPLPNTMLLIRLAQDGTTVNLAWPAEVGPVVLERSTDLQTWTAWEPQPGSTSVIIPVVGQQQFFRLTRP